MLWFLVLSGTVTALAWAVTQRRREHRPVALFFTLAFFSDLIRWLIRVQVLIPARERFGADPFSGWVRLVWHADQSLYLAWRAGVAGLALVVFLRRAPWPALVAWVVTECALGATYPLTRGAVLQQCYLAVELATLATAAGCYVMWWWRREPPTFQNLCVLLVIAGEIALAIGPYTKRNVFTSWNIAQAMLTVVFVVLLAVHGGVLWGSSARFRKS